MGNTSIGLALAHWFAFSLSARFVAQGRLRRKDGLVAVAQLTGRLPWPCSRAPRWCC